jgi:hypothetical protein
MLLLAHNIWSLFWKKIGDDDGWICGGKEKEF